MNKYKLILFDVDDTLMDFEITQKLAFKFAIESIGIIYTDEILKTYKELNEKIWKELEAQKIKTVADLFIERCKRLFKALNIEGDIKTFNTNLSKGFVDNIIPVEGMEETLRELAKHYKLGVITNGPTDQQHDKLKNSGISKYFSYVFVSQEVGYNKPDTRFFDYVFEHIEEKDKSKILVVGDSLTSDIKGGIDSGLDTCWFNMRNRKNNTNLKPNYEIKTLLELKEIL